MVTFEESPIAKTQTARVLAEAAVTDQKSDDFLYTIKYVTSIVLIIIFVVVTIILYTVQIERDSIIYAKFLVKKTN